PGGSMGASTLIMSAVTRFYDFYRPQLGNEPGKLRIYPDYFVFHVGKRHMNHTKMDIWPPHKDVILRNDLDDILEAINDRGITRLIVEDSSLSTPTFLRETISSAKRRIITALAYSPTGRTDRADVTMKSCLSAEENVLASVNMSKELSEKEKERLKKNYEGLIADGRITETYRRIKSSDAV